MRNCLVISLLICGCSYPTVAAAQTVEPPPAPDAGPVSDSNMDDSEIVVVGVRQRGDVVGTIPPDVRFTAGDVRALGVSSVTDLLTELAPHVSGGTGGRPIILINGLRTTSFAEVRDLPTEAIQRVDIYPAELALRYGYRADQRVVNIVLRKRFNATVAQLAPTIATGGGRASEKAQVTKLRIDDKKRWTIDGQYQHDSPLYESERDLINVALVGEPDQRPYRTLLSRTDTASLNGSMTSILKDGLYATLNIRGEAVGTRSGIGATSSNGGSVVPLIRDSDQQTGHVGAMVNGSLNGWQWSLTGNYDIVGTHSTTDRSASVRDSARSSGQTGEVELVASGVLVRLPAGDMTMTAQAGGQLEGYTSHSQRQAVFASNTLSRRTGSGQASVDVPIASARDHILQPLGTLSVNFNAAIDRVSDFGALASWGYGVSWAPIPVLNVVASVTHEEDAPTMQQLGDPLQVTPNARIFDYVRQETVDVARSSGGNPFLRAEKSHVFSLETTLRPFGEAGPRLSIHYRNTDIRNPIESFPVATAAVEAAFPGRFVRDGNGQLVAIDTRPVNFARSITEEVRWGINFSGRLGKAPPDTGDRRPPEGAAGRGTGGAGGMGFGGPGGGFGGAGFGARGRQARMQFSVYHTWLLRSDIQLQSGAPVLDLLNGATVDNGGGASRHQVDVQAGLTKNGLGFRLNGKWQGATHVRGATTTTGDLRFSSLGTMGVQLFAQLGAQREWAKKHPWMRGMRVSLNVDNLFDSQQKVRNSSGSTPVNYQPDYLNPLGRTIRLTVRKVFF